MEQICGCYYLHGSGTFCACNYVFMKKNGEDMSHNPIFLIYKRT